MLSRAACALFTGCVLAGASASTAAAATPTVSSFTPTAGGVGTSVTITGTNLTGATGVTFNGASAASVTPVSDTQVVAVVGPGAKSGKIAVTTPGGTATSKAKFTVPPPTITSFSPATSAALAPVTITGTGFTGATGVSVNGTPAASYTVISDTEIKAWLGSGTKTGKLSVKTPRATVSSKTLLKVAQVIELSTCQQSPATDYGVLIGSAIWFGTSWSMTDVSFLAQFLANTTTSLTVDGTSVPDAQALWDPQGLPGASSGWIARFNYDPNITVAAVGQRITASFQATTSAELQDGFDTYPAGTDLWPSNTCNVVGMAQAKLKSFLPVAGGVGTLVTITGTDLDGVDGIKFGQTSVSKFTHVSSTTLTTRVPSGASTAAITLTQRGAVPQTSKKKFTVRALPGSGRPLWLTRYDDGGWDYPAGSVLSPDGSTLYVAGEGHANGSGSDFTTIAYDTANGSTRWEAHYTGGLNLPAASALALSPDGTRLVVAGNWQFASALVVYNTATGQEVWSTTSNDDDGLPDRVAGLAISPDGETAFLAGYNVDHVIIGDYNYVTVAFDIALASRVWRKVFDSPANSFNRASALAISGDGSKVFVTGESPGSAQWDYTTVAYSAADGTQLWVTQYDGNAPKDGFDQPHAIASSPDGTMVFVTGGSVGASGTDFDYATVAYDAANGNQLWAKRYNGPVGDDVGRAVTVTPDGSKVIVTGESTASSAWNAVTIAYATTTGDQLWGVRETSDIAARGSAIVASPDSKSVAIAGFTATTQNDVSTVVYDTTTHERNWVEVYAAPGNSSDQATSVNIAPDGSKVYVTADTGGDASDWLTMAYPN